MPPTLLLETPMFESFQIHEPETVWMGFSDFLTHVKD